MRSKNMLRNLSANDNNKVNPTKTQKVLEENSEYKRESEVLVRN